jgi:hypothetical protein
LKLHRTWVTDEIRVGLPEVNTYLTMWERDLTVYVSHLAIQSTTTLPRTWGNRVQDPEFMGSKLSDAAPPAIKNSWDWDRTVDRATPVHILCEIPACHKAWLEASTILRTAQFYQVFTVTQYYWNGRQGDPGNRGKSKSWGNKGVGWDHEDSSNGYINGTALSWLLPHRFSIVQSQTEALDPRSCR